MAYKLTLSTVLKKGCKAYAAGKLQFQQPDLRGQRCMYGSPCIIGAALPKDLALAIDAKGPKSVDAIRAQGFIACSEDHMNAFRELQTLHDELSTKKWTAKERDKRLKRFKRRLDPAFWANYFRKARKSAKHKAS